MCGIAGIVSSIPSELVSIERMTNAIAHRGPDGEGHWLNENKTVALGHRRLSIIDLSDDAKQPMHFGNGRYTISFNGEIYNYIEIKEQLLKKGIKFFSNSDTEVLLALYSEKGADCLKELDGMFAFTIWDEKEKTLFCARDRFGEKPFFFHHEQGKKFVFASEMKALFAYGIPKELNRQMMFNFFHNMFILTNPEKRWETFYYGINKLEPAHYLIIDSNLNLVKKRYWDIDLNKENIKVTENEAIEKFKELFELSTKLRLRSDVPVGSSLSGGLDSSTIVCLIDKINSESKITQKTFSARFKDFDKDEGKYMEMVINKTKVQPHFTWPDENTFISDFDKMFYHQEEPFATASILAQWSVMKLANENKVTVLLDGQGADEILAGYNYYFHTYLHDLYKNDLPLYEKELMAYREMHNPAFIGFSGSVQNILPTKSASLKTKLKDVVRPMYRTLVPSKVKSLLQVDGNNFLHPQYSYQFSSSDIFDSRFDGNLKEQLYLNSCMLGLEDLLRFSDRNSMAFSREVRLPFLNHQLVEFVFSLPATYKIHNGWTKYILRKSFEDILPKEIAWRKDKIGYEPPQKKWLQTPKITEWINDSKSKLESDKIINPGRDKTKDNDWLCLMASKLMD